MTLTPRLYACSFASAGDLNHVLRLLRGETGVSPVRIELLPVSTCQRHELFVLTSESFHPPVNTLRTFESADAALRLFQIAAGVLSDIPGEVAVAHQVRRAMRAALRQGLAGTDLAKLVRRALRSGDLLRERVRRSAPILELTDLLPPLIAPGTRVILLGAGALGRNIAACGLALSAWGTRTPRQPNQRTIKSALQQLRPGDTLIAALAGDREPFSIEVDDITSIDLGESPTIRYAHSTRHASAWTLTDVIEHSRQRLTPQVQAVARAAHRLPAQAEAALAETLCPQIRSINRAISVFRERIVDAELNRLGSILEACDDATAQTIRRSVNHAAARSTHPLHEYVNALGRQGRAGDARLLVDHILGSRIGIAAHASIDGGTGISPERVKEEQT